MKQNLLRKLQEKVKSLSVNSLGNLYPDDIMEGLNISEEEAKKFIDFLHSKRILAYKYRIKCSCSERCTVFENQLARSGAFNCEVCGYEFQMQEIKDRAEIIYEIDKAELLKLESKKIEFKEFPYIKSKVIPIKQRQEEIKVMAKNEIFIGSSSEMIDYMDNIALKLEKMKETPLLWNDESKGIFVAGTNTIDSLIEITERVKTAIFIFNEDDKVWFDGKSSILNFSENAVRDNVLFEYGLFMGALGKGKVCFICKGKPHIASDLQGITYIDGDLGDAQVKARLKAWVKIIK